MIKSVTLRRIIAWIIDWNVCLFPPVIACMVLANFLNEESVIYYLIAILCLLLILSAFAMFVLRDVIFKGRSLGKRLFELYVYEKNSLQQATKKQLISRNIFFFLYLVDVFVLIFTGETIGDRVAGTVVVSESMRESSPD